MPYVNGMIVEGVVVHLVGRVLKRCHSEPALSARNLLFAVKQQIPRAITPRLE